MALDPNHKVRSIIKYVLVTVVIVLILMWLWAGGWALMKNAALSLPNPIDILWGTSTSTYHVKLPWEINAPRGPDISGLTEQGGSLAGQDPNEQLSDLQSQYQEIRSQAEDLRALGTPSPYRGTVALLPSGAREGGTDAEYVELVNRGSADVSVSGWSLQSMLSGTRAYIPQAAQPFIQGALNRVSPVSLAPREIAIVTTGASPVGVSFRETLCTGYLAQLQTFEPQLANACPSPLDTVPESIAGDLTYGSECFEFMRNIPQCQYVTSLPTSLSPNCRVLIANEFSYNGCVSENQRRSDFELDTWHLYLASGVPLWNNSHDIIRLLDENGRTVDAVSY